MINKEAKKDLGFSGIFLLVGIFIVIIFSGYFVFAAGAIVKNHTLGGTFEISEDTQFLFNISVNNTDALANVTQVNITLPDGFTFIGTVTNGTDNPNVAPFQNVGQVLSWENKTEGLV